MKTPKPKTKVIFRVFREGDVIALFPEIAANENVGICLSYQHVGQHGGADLMGMMRLRKATRAEYAPLASELRRAGYNLKVIDRVQPGMMAERRRQIARIGVAA